MNQLSMSFVRVPVRTIQTPIARRTDPESSHLAAEHVTRSGARAHQQAQAVAAVRAYPGCTSFELATRTDLDRYMLARRLPDAETAGAIRRGEQRVCQVSNRRALTWYPTA